MKTLFIVLFPLLSHAGFQWLYTEKIEAEKNCKTRYANTLIQQRSCILGVTVYGDARGWQGINTTRDQAQNSCSELCTGAMDNLAFCRAGCQFGRNSDK